MGLPVRFTCRVACCSWLPWLQGMCRSTCVGAKFLGRFDAWVVSFAHVELLEVLPHLVHSSRTAQTL